MPSTINDAIQNPLRNYLESQNLPPGTIQLSLGDPCKSGFRPPEGVIEAVKEVLESDDVNAFAYAPASGLTSAKEAIASRTVYRGLYKAEDVVLTHGCTGALDMAIKWTCRPGDSILLPRPGFPLYASLASMHGVQVVYYDLDSDWKINLEHIRKSIQPSTRAWLVNNPSNPCGVVLKKQELVGIAELAKELNVILIADEVYEDITLDECYMPLASLTDHTVITCGSLSKRFLLPGWRLGWLLVHDPSQICDRITLKDLAGISLGPCFLIQAALPKILSTIDCKYKKSLKDTLTENARVASATFSNLGFRFTMPQGALYMMVKCMISLD